MTTAADSLRTQYIDSVLEKDLNKVLKETPMANRNHDLDRFYKLLAKLEYNLHGTRLLGQCTGKMNWPNKGVYFFFENGEKRQKGQQMRVVRVGTHALSPKSKSKLWGRLRQHRGSKTGGGNHRASVFRKHVGFALMGKDSCPTWGRDKSADSNARAKEKSIEKMVSEHIGNMQFLWLDVSKTGERKKIERNAIGLLSNFGRKPACDPQSAHWLGKHSDNEYIKNSGLWNVDHVDEEYEDDFLSLLEGLIKRQFK